MSNTSTRPTAAPATYESRHKASLVDAERHLLACYRYIELNPARAGMVEHPADYPWSSYRANAYGEAESIVTAHPRFIALAKTAEAGRQAYRESFRVDLSAELLHQIRTAASFAVPLGNDLSKELVERALRWTTGRATRGRPPVRKQRCQ